MVPVDSALICGLIPRTEKAGSWKCTWCGRANVRLYYGLDHCSTCNAEAFTYFTGVENELGVRYSHRPPCLSGANYSTIADLRQQIDHDLRIQHPEWVQPDGRSPMCDAYEERLLELLDSFRRMESNESVAAVHRGLEQALS